MEPTRRRTLLALAGSAVAGLAGCASDSGSDTPGETPDTTPDDSLDDNSEDTPGGNAGETPDETPEAKQPSVQVDLSTPSYLVGAVPADDFPRTARDATEAKPVSTFPDPLANALRQAEDGGFETDDPSEELLAALDEARSRSYRRLTELSVRIDGTDYVAELEFPELDLQLEEQLLEEYDADRVISIEGPFETDKIGVVVRRIGWDGTPETARGRYVISQVPDDIEAFLDRYDYIEDHKGVSSIQVTRHNWEPPYSIELREYTEEDRWGRDIVDLQTLDSDLQALLRTAVEAGDWINGPPVVTDDVPESYFQRFQDEAGKENSPLVRFDDTVYRITVSEGTQETIPISLSVAPATPTADGLARFTVTVEVTDDKPEATVATGESVDLHSQIGLPSALWITHDDEHHLLNSDQYEIPVTSENDGSAWSLDVEDPELGETAVNKALAAGDELAATYTVPSTVPDGSYALAGSFGALWLEHSDDRSQTSGVFPYEIELALEGT